MKVLSWKLTLFLIAFALLADQGVVCLNKTEINALNSVDNTTDIVDREQSREAVLGMSFSLLELRYRDAILLPLMATEVN